MKQLIGILTLTMGLFGVSSAQKSSKFDTLQVKTQIYCDHCLECGSCAGKINTAMAGFYGIKKFEIQPGQNLITVIYNPAKVTSAQIRQAISSAGFDADNIPAKPEAVAKLDACCLKSP